MFEETSLKQKGRADQRSNCETFLAQVLRDVFINLVGSKSFGKCFEIRLGKKTRDQLLRLTNLLFFDDLLNFKNQKI